jgi:hypothetical protein
MSLSSSIRFSCEFCELENLLGDLDSQQEILKFLDPESSSG